MPGDPFWEQVIADSAVRLEVVRQNPFLFFHVYFAECMEYKTAPFQKEIFGILQDQSIKFAVIEAFRNSAKTTIVNKAYVLWSILGEQQKKHVLILAQTQEQGRLYMTNIKRKMSETLLRDDLGPFEEPKEEWRINSVVLPRYGARITVASVDQPIRGILHEHHRPDLIICDDLEDLNSVRNFDTRNKLYEWLTGDVIPLGDMNTRLIIIGTRLHDDSLIMRLKDSIEKNRIAGIFRSYPLVNEKGEIAWPGKYPDQTAIEAEKKRTGDERAWRREYLLETVGDTDQVIEKGWIQYYNHLPLGDDNLLYTITAIDLAISESERADYTAMVTAKAYVFKDDLYIYILPDMVNERLSYPEMTVRAKMIFKMVHHDYGMLVVEDVAFQRALIQDLEADGINVIGFRPGGTDKRTRLSLTAGKIKAGHVLFPRKGAEQLIGQIVHFGREKHDDLSDAFTMVVLEAVNNYGGVPTIQWI